MAKQFAENALTREFLTAWDQTWFEFKNATLRADFLQDQLFVSGQTIVDAMFGAASMAIQE